MILEFQSSVDYRMPIRLLLYMISSKKFKVLPSEYIIKIRTLPERVVETIATDVFEIESVEELEKYFII